MVIVPYRDGPYLVRGPVAMRDQRGNPMVLARDTIALCRCGRSQTRPFCDGTHRAINFQAPSEIEREPTSGYQGTGPANAGAALKRAEEGAKLIPGDTGRRARALIAGALALSQRAVCQADRVAPLVLIADAIQAIACDGPVNRAHDREVIEELRMATRGLEAQR